MSDPLASFGGDAAASAGGAGDAAPTAAVFKKKSGGAKRKEFRAPAASLAARSDAPPPEPPVAAVPAAVEAVVAIPTRTIDVHSSDLLTITSVGRLAASAASSTSVEAGRPATAVDSDSDHDDGDAPFSAAAAAAQAADVDTSDPEESDEEADGGVQRPAKRAKKANPLAASTRNKLKKEHNLTIQSARSVMPDERTADKQITQVVEAAKIARDPSKPKWSGPTKPQASNVRMISRMDYEPNVCKDYKETGRCGYGDSCVFLHDRGVYKQSWQIDADWNAAQEAKRKKALLGDTGETDAAAAGKDEEGQLPWACLICREGFVRPVVTKCSHYFCEKCALDAYVKDTKCFACRQQTHGIFNTATKLIAVIKQRATQGKDPKAELEKLEKARLAEKEAIATGDKWQLPGRTAGL